MNKLNTNDVYYTIIDGGDICIGTVKNVHGYNDFILLKIIYSSSKLVGKSVGVYPYELNKLPKIIEKFLKNGELKF